MEPMVLLRHTLADGSVHFDWMMQRAGGGPLLTFRAFERIDALAGQGFMAEMLGDHRADYLDYEGPISGGRGSVKRVARGVCEVEEEESRIEIVADWGDGPRCYRGTRRDEKHWEFRVGTSGPDPID